MLAYFDAHNHLYREDFTQDIEEVVGNAEKSGVKGCLVVAEKSENFEEVLKLNERFPHFCLPCLGLHPVQGDDDGEARSVSEKDLEEALPLIEKYHEKLVAIGEVGLDFTPRFCKSDTDKEQQRLVLTMHIECAKKYDLPINVHSRSAGRPTIALLKEQGVTKALLHAFDGRPSVAMEGVAAGYYFSIPPSIVRSEQKQKLVKQIPLENLLLETDSPALGPEKQVRNVPSNIEVSCKYIAQIKQVDVETVAKITFENTLKLFPKVKNFIKL